MHTKKTGTQALVLGGGSVAGVAWELGMITGLSEKGVDVREADLIIGTSAGSLVSAQITSGTDLESLFASQLTPVEPATERKGAPDLERMREVFSQAVAETGSDLKALRARIGAYALAAPTVSEAERRAYIAAQLPSHTWPEQRLLFVAVDTATGEEFLMDRESGVPLVDAVAASCAVPGLRPPVTIAGRRYMDGGMRSGTNADLAKGSERVLILAPLGARNIAEEVAALEQEGSQVLVLRPDAASVTAIGQNPADPATRRPSALAGRAQGHELAGAVAAFLSQN